MAYITVTLNHVRAVKAWVESHGGQAHIDVARYALEVQAYGRSIELFAQFLARLHGRLCYVPGLQPEVNGFVGWLPYRPRQWDLSRDKRVFKRFLGEMGIATPALFERARDATADFIVKHSVGSFGYEVAGPFSPLDRAAVEEADAAAPLHGARFAEEFVRGRNLKVWFWGAVPFHAHLHDYPAIVGDGERTVSQLVVERLADLRLDLQTYPELRALKRMLAYQCIALDEVAPEGRTLWLDFRYGRRLAADDPTSLDDNDLPHLPSGARRQAETVGRAVVDRLPPPPSGAALYSVDGVVDEDGKVWWLEINSNPTLPPTGYEPMLTSLFQQSECEPGSARLAKAAS